MHCLLHTSAGKTGVNMNCEEERKRYIALMNRSLHKPPLEFIKDLNDFLAENERLAKQEQKVKAPCNEDDLVRILTLAYEFYSKNKTDVKSFSEQPFMEYIGKYGIGFQIGRTAMKLDEATSAIKKNDKSEAINKLLDAIILSSAAILHLEKSNG